tara:strand:- start:16 stop:624 length:609 start_codon:yes stop_codon:yes gene_type:complete
MGIFDFLRYRKGTWCIECDGLISDGDDTICYLCKAKKNPKKVEEKEKLDKGFNFKKYDNYSDDHLSNMLMLKEDAVHLIKGLSDVLKVKANEDAEFNDVSAEKKIYYDWEAIKEYLNIMSEQFDSPPSKKDFKMIMMKTEVVGSCIFDFGAMDYKLLDQIAFFLLNKITIHELDKEFQLYLLRDTNEEIEILKKIYNRNNRK